MRDFFFHISPQNRGEIWGTHSCLVAQVSNFELRTHSCSVATALRSFR